MPLISHEPLGSSLSPSSSSSLIDASSRLSLLAHLILALSELAYQVRLSLGSSVSLFCQFDARRRDSFTDSGRIEPKWSS